MKVLIPSPLHSYTGGPRVEAEGESVAALLADLDRRYPGIRFGKADGVFSAERGEGAAALDDRPQQQALGFLPIRPLCRRRLVQ